MNDQKAIKKILSLARYDFIQNLGNWFSITGLLAVVLLLVFCGLCVVLSDYDVSYWGKISNLFFDWGFKLSDLIAYDIAYGFMGLILLIVTVAVLFFPLVSMQNSLDLAFDSSMRGLSVTGPIISYVFMMIGTSLLVLSILFGLSYFGFFVGIQYLMLFLQNYMHTSISFLLRVIEFTIYGIIFYIIQIQYMAMMHILEYKKSIWESYQELFSMISGKLKFLGKMLCIQTFIVTCVLAFLYYCLGFVIAAIMPIIIWMFDMLHVSLEPIIIYMMYNFFYLWAYLLLYSSVCLVRAHMYRYLVCPPVENVTCQSCNSCSK